MLPVLIKRDHLHRNVPRGRVLLELAQDRPAQHIRQEHVQRYRRRAVFLRQRQGIRTAHRHQPLEALSAGQIDQEARVVRIVLDDEQDR